MDLPVCSVFVIRVYQCVFVFFFAVRSETPKRHYDSGINTTWINMSDAQWNYKVEPLMYHYTSCKCDEDIFKLDLKNGSHSRNICLGSVIENVSCHSFSALR